MTRVCARLGPTGDQNVSRHLASLAWRDHIVVGRPICQASAAPAEAIIKENEHPQLSDPKRATGAVPIRGRCLKNKRNKRQVCCSGVNLTCFCATSWRKEQIELWLDLKIVS